MGWVCIKKLDYYTLLCGNIFLFLFLDFFGYCFMWLENQIPGMNLQMSISAKVDDIMIKIADYSVKWSHVCCISSLCLNYITNKKTVQLIYYGSYLGFIFFTF